MSQNIVFISHWDFIFMWLYDVAMFWHNLRFEFFFWCVKHLRFWEIKYSFGCVSGIYKSMAECSVIHVPPEKAASPNSAVNSNQGEINLIWPGVSSGQLFSWLTWKWGLLYISGYYHSSTVITVSYMCPCCLLRQYLYSSSELLSRWGSSGLWQGAGGSCIILS